MTAIDTSPGIETRFGDRFTTLMHQRPELCAGDIAALIIGEFVAADILINLEHHRAELEDEKAIHRSSPSTEVAARHKAELLQAVVDARTQTLIDVADTLRTRAERKAFRLSKEAKKGVLLAADWLNPPAPAGQDMNGGAA